MPNRLDREPALASTDCDEKELSMGKPEETTKRWLDPARLTPRVGSIYPAPFAAPVAGREKRALGDPLGLTQFGVNLVTLGPGSWSSQRHWHENEDEFIYVLEGTPTLVSDAGETQLQPGMCAGFAAGGTAHHLENRTNRDVVVLEVGDRPAGDEVFYPADDIQAVMGDDGKWRFTRKDGTPYA